MFFWTIKVWLMIVLWCWWIDTMASTNPLISNWMQFSYWSIVVQLAICNEWFIFCMNDYFKRVWTRFCLNTTKSLRGCAILVGYDQIIINILKVMVFCSGIKCKPLISIRIRIRRHANWWNSWNFFGSLFTIFFMNFINLLCPNIDSAKFVENKKH